MDNMLVRWLIEKHIQELLKLAVHLNDINKILTVTRN